MGVLIAQWFERRTRDRRVAGSSSAGGEGEFSSPGLTFFADSYSGIRSTPCYRSSMHVNNPGHSAKNAVGRLQLNTQAP